MTREEKTANMIKSVCMCEYMCVCVCVSVFMSAPHVCISRSQSTTFGYFLQLCELWDWCTCLYLLSHLVSPSLFLGRQVLSLGWTLPIGLLAKEPWKVTCLHLLSVGATSARNHALLRFLFCFVVHLCLFLVFNMDSGDKTGYSVKICGFVFWSENQPGLNWLILSSSYLKGRASVEKMLP